VDRAPLVALVWLASCGVRAPAPIDVDALLRTRGPLEARRDLVIRIAADGRDVQAHLALAALDDQLRRPSEAIDELEAVVAVGGPLGVRWRDTDQARLARLIAARGRARLARGAATARTDLEHARQLGAAIDDAELHRARVDSAIAALRHSDADVRATGRRILADEAARSTPPTGGGGATDDAGAWAGAAPEATVEQRGRFGAWLWAQGARRAAWDELAAWHAAARVPRDGRLEEAYLVTARWWTPLDLPAAKDIGLDEAASEAMRCAFVACAPRDVVGDDALERAYLTAPPGPSVRDPANVAAVVVIALHQALRGEVSWGAAIAARVDLPAFGRPGELTALPRFVQPVIARLAGRDGGDGAVPSPDASATADQRLVIAAEHALAGAPTAEVVAIADGVPGGEALRTMVAPSASFVGEARAEAVARHASLAVMATAQPGTSAGARVASTAGASSGVAGTSLELLRAIAAAFARDPAIADRLGRDAVAGAVDAAAMHAMLAALFDAIGDPARARAAWQAAVDRSPEPRFLRGLACAEARQGDGDAALVAATTAAAASGDPAVAWLAVARALDGAGRHVHALESAHSAIDLAGPEVLAPALEVAIAASRALGRDGQAAALAAQRARVAPVNGTLGARDPTDAPAAVEAYRARADAPASQAAIDRLWTAARWNPRDVEVRATLLAALLAADPRRAVVVGELVELAGDRDAEVGRAAAAALR
jgi:tetratricopeptide (TPR) repeat protein